MGLKDQFTDEKLGMTRQELLESGDVSEEEKETLREGNGYEEKAEAVRSDMELYSAALVVNQMFKQDEITFETYLDLTRYVEDNLSML